MDVLAPQTATIEISFVEILALQKLSLVAHALAKTLGKTNYSSGQEQKALAGVLDETIRKLELGIAENRAAHEAIVPGTPDWIKEAVAAGQLVEVEPGHWVKPGESFEFSDGRRSVADAAPSVATEIVRVDIGSFNLGADEAFEKAAKRLERRVTEIAEEHGDYEPDTNYTNLPDWAESVCEELETLAKTFRALKVAGVGEAVASKAEPDLG
jgi:hypothetical protein